MVCKKLSAPQGRGRWVLGGGDGASGCWFGRSDEASVEDIRARRASGMDLNGIVGSLEGPN